MPRSIFGWDLPPGVTTRMIEDAYGGGDDMDYTALEFKTADEAWKWLEENEYLDLFRGFLFKDTDMNEARLTRNKAGTWLIELIPNE